MALFSWPVLAVVVIGGITGFLMSLSASVDEFIHSTTGLTAAMKSHPGMHASQRHSDEPDQRGGCRRSGAVAPCHQLSSLCAARLKSQLCH